MTKDEKWKILREVPVLSDDVWYSLTDILDEMIDLEDIDDGNS